MALWLLLCKQELNNWIPCAIERLHVTSQVQCSTETCGICSQMLEKMRILLSCYFRVTNSQTTLVLIIVYYQVLTRIVIV